MALENTRKVYLEQCRGFRWWGSLKACDNTLDISTTCSEREGLILREVNKCDTTDEARSFLLL